MTEINTGEWRAIISDAGGWVASPEDVGQALALPGSNMISVRRGSALPEEYGGYRATRDGEYFRDIFFRISVEDLEEDFRAEAWELAQRAAWGMNQDPAFVARMTAGASADFEGGADYGDRTMIAELRAAAKRVREGAPVDPAHIAVWLECVAIDEKSEHESAARFKERFNALQLARAVNAAAAQASPAEETLEAGHA